MSNRMGLWAGTAFAVVAVATSAWAGGKGTSRKAPGETVRRNTAEALIVSGEFSGNLDGAILIGDTTFQVTDRTQIYEIGNGLVPKGTEVSRRLVFVSGTVRRDANWADVVIVRPAGELDNVVGDDGASVHEKDPSAPR